KVTEEWLLFGKEGRDAQRPETMVSIPVLLPNEDVLTEMFAGLLTLEGIDPDEGGRARTLAQLFPNALALAASHQGPPGSLRESIRAEAPHSDGGNRPSRR